MKKIIIAILITIIIIAAYLIINPKQSIDKVLLEFETYETDGFYKNNESAEGYIVANKTEEGYRYGYVNYKGKLLLDAEYNHIHRVMEVEDKDEIYLIAAKNGRYGVNFNGKHIIKCEYQFIEYISEIEGFILQKSDKYGLANIKGEIIIPVQNELVEVKGKYIYVTKEDESKVYDKLGKIQNIDFNTTINPIENEKYYIKTVENDANILYGIVDLNGKDLVKTKYTYIEYLFENYFVACNEQGNEGIIDASDNIKLKFKYNLVQKIQNTNLIRTLNSKTNETEIYNKNIEKICEMTNANIASEGELIKIYNQTETKFFNKNGIEINK